MQPADPSERDAIEQRLADHDSRRRLDLDDARLDAESALDRALRDGGDEPRDPDAPNEAALDLVRRAAARPRPSSSDPRVNEALGGIDSDDVFKIAFTQRYGVL